MTNAQHDAYICQQELTQDLNDRRFSRLFSSKPLEPFFEFRAVPTREQTMPVFDCRKNHLSHLYHMINSIQEKYLTRGIEAL